MKRCYTRGIVVRGRAEERQLRSWKVCVMAAPQRLHREHSSVCTPVD